MPVAVIGEVLEREDDEAMEGNPLSLVSLLGKKSAHEVSSIGNLHTRHTQLTQHRHTRT